MTKDVDGLDPVDIDEALAVEVFKRDILGRTVCTYAEGSWDAHPDTQKENWGCYAEVRPVYVGHCACSVEGWAQYRYPKYPKLGNHENICLEVVLPYSTELDYAMLAIKQVSPCSFTLTFIDDLWIAELHDAVSVYTAKVHGELVGTAPAALALSRAVLKFVRGGARVPSTL
jgi:hypothetical protein